MTHRLAGTRAVLTARVRHDVAVAALTVAVLVVAAVIAAVTGWSPFVIGLAVAAVLLIGVVR